MGLFWLFDNSYTGCSQFTVNWYKLKYGNNKPISSTFSYYQFCLNADLIFFILIFVCKNTFDATTVKHNSVVASMKFRISVTSKAYLMHN